MRETAAIRANRILESDPYQRRFTWPKWNRLVTVTDVYQLFRSLPEFADWTPARHLQISGDYLAMAQMYRDTAAALIARGEKIYGTDSSLIAGGFREAWPDALKDAIRVHSYGASDFELKSLAHWQAAGKRIETWRQAHQ